MIMHMVVIAPMQHMMPSQAFSVANRRADSESCTAIMQPEVILSWKARMV